MHGLPPIETLVDQAQEFLPTLEVTPCDPDTAALGYAVRFQLPWQSQVQTLQMDTASLEHWLTGVLAGAYSAVYWHMREHAEEPAQVGTDCAMIVVTNEDGLREDLQAALFAGVDASPRPPDAPPLPAVYDLGNGMRGIGAYGKSGCPAAIVVSTLADGCYGVRLEWDTRFDEEHGEVPTGTRVVIDLSGKMTRAEQDELALELARWREAHPRTAPDEER